MKKLVIFIFFLLLSLQSVQASKVVEDLEELYRANPGLMTQLNPDILKLEAMKVLKNKERVFLLMQFVKGDLAKFTRVREEIVSRLRVNPGKKLRRVVVSGQSVTGMVAAAIAAQSGHKVNVYDLRMSFTREIQWSVRQSVPDSLAAIDTNLAMKFLEKGARDLDRGYTVIHVDGQLETDPPLKLKKPDPRRIPQNALDMLQGADGGTVQTRVFEEVLFDYLSKHPNVTQMKGKIELGEINPMTNERMVSEYQDVTPKGQKEKIYKQVISTENPIVIIAEGAGSSSRGSLKIESGVISLARLQVAGIVHIENSDEIVTHYRSEGNNRLITGSMGTKGSNKRWVVGDVNAESIRPDRFKFGTDPKAQGFIEERARLLEIEFKRMAALNMRMPIEQVANLKVSGAIEGLPLQTFELEQHISRQANASSNVLLLGDAVGNAHWSVGGGMHIGSISHGERLKQYLSAVDAGESIKAAAVRYGEGALEDSRAWGQKGLHYFYNTLSDEDSAKAYNTAADLFLERKIASPKRALDLMLPEGVSSEKIKNIKLECIDIPRRILGDI